MNVIYLNGIYVNRSDAKISISNRAFRYADGCFEAIRIMNGYPVFWSLHWDRLTRTLEMLQIELMLNESAIKEVIVKLISMNQCLSGMLRIVVSRADGGKYMPLGNEAQVFMELTEMETPHYPEPITLKRAVLFEEFRLPSHELGNHKTLNKTLHVLAALSAKASGCDEAFLVNDKGAVAEAISSNMCLLKNKVITTPPLSDGGLNGTIRRVLLQNSNSIGVKIIEHSITPSELLEADEIWATNASSGISAVTSYAGKSYSADLANRLQARLNSLAISSVVDFQEIQPL
ncbi:MAG: aminotransferase class IV [Flavobacteriales bacterium]